MSGLQYKIIQYVEDQSQKKNNSIEISYEIIQMLEWAKILKQLL